MTLLSRRDFVRRGSLWIVGTAIATDASMLERLLWKRKSFPSARIPGTYAWIENLTGKKLSKVVQTNDDYWTPVVFDSTNEVVIFKIEQVFPHSEQLVYVAHLHGIQPCSVIQVANPRGGSHDFAITHN